jgi:O-succinylbenzoate synthase
MLETGIGRAMNVALASLPNFTLPGDVSASDRFWAHDIVTEPIRLEDGWVSIPQGPGSGVEIDADWLDSVTTSRVELRP